MAIAELLVTLATIYFVCGVAFGVPFVLRGVNRVDAAAHGSSLAFRLLLLPGTIALWPVMVRKWLSARRPEEHS
jgi:hypothetical protein